MSTSDGGSSASPSNATNASASGANATNASTSGANESTAEQNGTTSDGSDLRGVYVQTFLESMSMQGMATAGPYKVALMFTVPHTFWNVVGTELQETPKADHTLHLMAAVWDPETNTVLPETGLSAEILRDGETVSQEVIYPMLSQPMGFHYGGNFTLPGEGTYSTKLSIGGMNIERRGAFEGKFGEPATATIPLEFTQATKSEVKTRSVEEGGQPGALAPMDAMFPQAIAPKTEALPGTILGEATSGDAVFVLTQIESGGGKPYTVASARTPYNRLLIPAMTLELTATRDGETVYEGPLARTLDPDLKYHYGARTPPLQSGDELTLTVTTPPQVARHEGYEEAFLKMPQMSITV
jgi:uncharacterized protein YjbI with pentapeptide repeats